MKTIIKRFLEWITLKEKLHTTTQGKEGSWFVLFEHQGKKMVACLHQTRVIDYRRLSSKIGKIDTNDYARVRDNFTHLYIK